MLRVRAYSQLLAEELHREGPYRRASRRTVFGKSLPGESFA